MTLENIIATIIVVAILGSAIAYILRARKKGVKCIGCPDGADCAKRCAGCCSSNKEK